LEFEVAIRTILFQDLLIFFNSKASTSIAGFLIITVSIIAIYSQRKTARQKTSLEFLDKLVSNKRLIDSAKFKRLIDLGY
jgi:hypothetical protein